jgi:hypothetical protein
MDYFKSCVHNLHSRGFLSDDQTQTVSFPSCPAQRRAMGEGGGGWLKFGFL